VIPTEVRRKMGLREGTRFLVIGLEDVIVLRRLQLSNEKLRLKKLLAEARSSAKTHGLSEKEIERLVHDRNHGKTSGLKSTRFIATFTLFPVFS
jgi:AbrB family looped-hinge helix DNA binding protein